MNKVILLTLSSLFLNLISHAACPDGKTYPIHFTFDDGPHTALTPRVLDTLKVENVPATFFISADNMPGGKENSANRRKYALLDRMLDEGHLIGSHTFHHIEHNHSDLSPAEVRENIQLASDVLRGYESPILRLPYGAGSFSSTSSAVTERNRMVMETVKSEGYTHVGWDIDTNDWSAARRATLLPTMLKDICQECKRHKDGACVILFHDVQANTVENLKDWIRAVKAEGHQFVPLQNDSRYEAAIDLPDENACSGLPVTEPAPLLNFIKPFLNSVRRFLPL
jgi:peptidoglycan/xylan/chitin deacetylase (PgdA/CDA1 family)